MSPDELDPVIGRTDGCPLDLDSIPRIEVKDGFIEVNMSDGLHQVNEEDVVASLTHDGKHPIEYSFLLGEWGQVAFWQPLDGGIYVRHGGDNLLGAACRRYLKSRHQIYETLSAVYAAAKSNQWPGWELAEKDPRNPSEAAIRIWAADPDAVCPENWEVVVFGMGHDELLLELAADEKCSKHYFFLRCLYLLVGDFGRGAWNTAYRGRIERLIKRAEKIGESGVALWVARSRQLIAHPEPFDYDEWCASIPAAEGRAEPER
jgi:hypothetical protein